MKVDHDNLEIEMCKSHCQSNRYHKKKYFTREWSCCAMYSRHQIAKQPIFYHIILFLYLVKQVYLYILPFSNTNFNPNSAGLLCDAWTLGLLCLDLLDHPESLWFLISSWIRKSQKISNLFQVWEIMLWKKRGHNQPWILSKDVVLAHGGII